MYVAVMQLVDNGVDVNVKVWNFSLQGQNGILLFLFVSNSEFICLLQMRKDALRKIK